MIAMQISGEDFKNLDKEVLLELKPEAEAAVQYGADLIADNARRLLGRRGTGRTYLRFFKSKRRKGRDIARAQSSVPGDPPARETGKLQAAVYSSKAKWRGWTVMAFAGIRPKKLVPIAWVLEFGGRVGRNGAVMLPPRPFMRPAEQKARALVLARMERL